MKLLFWLRGQYSNSMEQKYFQTICMPVITIQSTVNMLFWHTLWQLHDTGVQGKVIQNIACGITLIFTVITQLFALLITATYLKQIRPSKTRLTRENLDLNDLHNFHKSNKTVTLKGIERSLDED